MQSLNKLFTVRYGHSLELNALEQVDPSEGVAFVSRTSKNNGVSAYVRRIPGLDPAPAGALSVSLGTRNYTLETSLQIRPFYCGRDVAYLVPLAPMTELGKLWWGECIKANRYRFNYGRQANRSLPHLLVPDQVPDWVAQASLPDWSMGVELEDVPELNAEDWSWFRIGSLFTLHRGRNVLRREMNVGATPYVSASAANNGVTAWIDLDPDWPAGYITVNSNGSVGEAFYQPVPFIASGDVTVLEPLSPLTPETALFVCTIVEADKYRWNYGRKWVTRRIAQSRLKLPRTPDGDPDWDSMQRYIEALPLAPDRLGGESQPA